MFEWKRVGIIILFFLILMVFNPSKQCLAEPVTYSIFTTQTPLNFYNSGQYELGTRFKVNLNGTITKVRIYAPANESGAHSVTIWSVSDVSPISGPHNWTITAGIQGWKEFTLPTSLHVTAGNDYIVSVSTGSNNYYRSQSEHGFDSPIDSSYITTYPGSGVYSTTPGAMPTSVSNNSNYFRDIVFIPDTLANNNSPLTIFSSETPSSYYNNIPYELGTKFKVSVNGVITKVRIYTHSYESGIHKVTIWRVSGVYRMTGPLPYDWNISSGVEGWKEFTLPTPVNVTAGIDYIVSVSTGSINYYRSQSDHGFDIPINSCYITTYTGSGVFSTTPGAMPTGVNYNCNYFRDIVFTPDSSIFSTQTPLNYSNNAQYEFGTKFNVNANGKITRVRIYTNVNESGAHTVRIWRVSDNSLVSGPYNWNISSGVEGWREYFLPIALNVTAGANYIVSVSAGTDNYCAQSEHGFDNPINNSYITTYTGSGVYSTTLGTLPTSVSNNSIYFRDVVFIPDSQLITQIFTTQIPVNYYNNSFYELGTKFKVSVSGTITKVRIYANANESGAHTVRIWLVSNGTVVSGPHNWSISSGVEGWKEFTLSTPLNVIAGTDYIVSVSTSADNYRSQSENGFNSPISNNCITTYTGSGLYTTTAGCMPTNISNNSNYFRDIVFIPDNQPNDSNPSCKALVLVNSDSAYYNDYVHFIQPYLNYFGIPYQEIDVKYTLYPSINYKNYSLIIFGHKKVFSNIDYPGVLHQLENVISNGVGLYSFDSKLFDYQSNLINVDSFYPLTSNGTQLTVNNNHFVTSSRSANEVISLFSNMNVEQNSILVNSTPLVYAGNVFLLETGSIGNGKIVRWNEYNWMLHTVKGPVFMNDLIWKSIVWAAQKPFVMQGLPPFVTMRVDDVAGANGLDWIGVCNQYGLKPWCGVFTRNLDSISINELKQYVQSGSATAFPHALYGDPDYPKTDIFIYYDHQYNNENGRSYDDYTLGNYASEAKQFFSFNNLTMSKVAIPHYYEYGSNSLYYLIENYGCEFIGTHITPDTSYNGSPSWVNCGPFRLYENGYARGIYEVYYADYLQIPDSIYNKKLFNCLVEIRDLGYRGYEWAPTDDSPQELGDSIMRGFNQVKRSLDGMVLSSLFTHETSYIRKIELANWNIILSDITSQLSSYNPEYVTTDYAYQYIRAKVNLTITDVINNSNFITIKYAGNNDMNTRCYVFTENNGTINSSVAGIPEANGSGEVTFNL